MSLYERNKKNISSIVISIFTLNFLILGIGSYVINTADAATLNVRKENILENVDSIDFDRLAKKADLMSFLGKPVRISLPSTNPDGIPGGDLDYVFIYPPQFLYNSKLNKSINFPIRTIYFASGKKIDGARTYYVKNVMEKQINAALNDSELLGELKEKLLESAKNKHSFLDVLKHKAKALGINVPQVFAQEDVLGDLNLDEDSLETILNSDDPEANQLLLLLLLLLLVDQVSAEGLNLDKEACIEAGGDWVNNECVLDPTEEEKVLRALCEESEGEWKEFENECYASLETCDAAEEYCYEIYDPVWSCDCPEETCLGAEGKCIKKDTGEDDDDGDGVKNKDDKCPDTSEGEEVNKVEGSDIMGCSCYQLRSKGKIQKRDCPPTQCEGNYLVEYPEDGEDTCEYGIVTEFACSPISRRPDEECAEANQQSQEEEQEEQQQEQPQQQEQGGGQQGGGQQGGGQQQGGSPNGSPTPTPSPEKPPVQDMSKLDEQAAGEAEQWKWAKDNDPELKGYDAMAKEEYYDLALDELRSSATNYQNNPDDPDARKRLEASLANYEKAFDQLPKSSQDARREELDKIREAGKNPLLEVPESILNKYRDEGIPNPNSPSGSTPQDFLGKDFDPLGGTSQGTGIDLLPPYKPAIPPTQFESPYSNPFPQEYKPAIPPTQFTDPYSAGTQGMGVLEGLGLNPSDFDPAKFFEGLGDVLGDSKEEKPADLPGATEDDKIKEETENETITGAGD